MKEASLFVASPLHRQRQSADVAGGAVGRTVELAGLKSERSQTMTDTIDDVAAESVEQEPAGPAIDG
jgi:hypothetical protein